MIYSKELEGMCENKAGYAKKQKFTKAHKARNTKKN